MMESSGQIENAMSWNAPKQSSGNLHNYNCNGQSNTSNSKTKRETSILQPITCTEHKNNLDTPEVKQKQQQQLNDTPSSFLNRLVLYFGKYKAASESISHEVGSVVEEFLQATLKNAAKHDTRFVGRLRACGSYYEGVKIKRPNHFDYLLELSESSLSIEDINLTNVIPDTLTPRINTDVHGLIYFKAHFNGAMNLNWLCEHCKRNNQNRCSHRRELKGRQIQQDFCRAVQRGASELDRSWNDVQIQCSGPAVTINTKLNRDVAKRGLLNKHGSKKLEQHPDIEDFIIKIHITLGIPIERKATAASWPLQDYEDMLLKGEVPAKEYIRKCHLVIAGDFWRVSCSHYETQTMQKLTENPWKKHCFQALKYLRDQIVTEDKDENLILSTHALKVSFLRENRINEKDEYWRFWSLSDRIRGMLNNTQPNGIGNYSNDNTDDAVSVEYHCALGESKSILKYLDKMEYQYHTHGIIHLVLMVLLCCSHFLVLAFSSSFLSVLTDEGVYCGDHANNLGSFTFAHLPLSFISLVISATGVVWIGLQRTILHSSSVVYDMYPSVLYIYIIMTIMDTLLAGLGIGLAVSERRSADYDCNQSEIMSLTLSSICLSAIFLMAVIVHMLIYVVAVRGKIKQHKWEFVFPDFVYKQAFPCLRRNTRDPPRVSVSVSKKENVAEDMDSDCDYDNIGDGPISTLERNRRKLRRQITESTHMTHSYAHRKQANYYENQNGNRFDPISPMQSPSKLSLRSSTSEPSHSPSQLHLEQSGSRQQVIWVSSGTPHPPENYCTLPSRLSHISLNAKTQQNQRHRAKHNGLEVSSLHSKSSTPFVDHLATINEKTLPVYNEEKHQDIHVFDVKNHSYDHPPNRHTSISEPCLVLGCHNSEAESTRKPKMIIKSYSLVHDNSAPTNTRFVDVPI